MKEKHSKLEHGKPETASPGAFRVKFLGEVTVLMLVPAWPTLSWNEAAALAGSWPHELSTPPLQQFAIC
ncbi:hypothetical protein PanWU01x14_278040 [Parasponia andersonii]|uniref:Uncharacterized protein n=1 Tax=Parasponia andersonii TaxID=3476 RepID=A0A2P5B268_PARAD|nr:hypothetical protein PanWU01x14_278040 [Parasponia andersonii]